MQLVRARLSNANRSPILQLIQGKMERRLAEAEARGETAAVLAAQAERVEEQAHVATVTAEAAVSWC